MRIEEGVINEISVVKLHGRLDGEYPMQLIKKVHGLVDSNPNIIMDCQDLEYMDTSGLGALLSCRRKAVSKNGDVRIAALIPGVNVVFELTKTHKIFRIFKTLQNALASFD